jgi:hypothetical protein
MLSDYLTISIILLVIVILIVVTLLYRKVGTVPEVTVDPEMMKGIITISWKELGFDEDIGAIKMRADDILRTSQGLENLFKVTRGRAEYGEFQLEQILKDILPSRYVHIRERLPVGIPDAHIFTPQGKILCIDSKFPCDNYRRMLEAKDQAQRTMFVLVFTPTLKGMLTQFVISMSSQKKALRRSRLASYPPRRYTNT